MFRTPDDPRLGTFVEAFAAAAAANADAIAVADATRSVTFREAERLTAASAHLLAERLHDDDHSGRGVGEVPGGAPVPVGLMTAHDAQSVLGILSVVRAGRLIVLLDTHLPEARLRHVAALAGVVDIVADDANADLAASLIPDGGAVVGLEALLGDAAELASGDQLIPPVPGAERDGDTPFVIIFTSGSTGMPKGVTLSQRQVMVDAGISLQVTGSGPGKRIAHVMPHSFAAGWCAVINALMLGASLYVIDARDVGTLAIIDAVAKYKITNFGATPHLARSMAAALDPSDDRLRSITAMLTVGEPITGPDIAAIRPLVDKDATFFNAFGSSETLAIAINAIPATAELPTGPVPAGRIVPGKSARIVRSDGTIAAPGETGELIVVSDAVTLGYWGDPAQTAKRAGTDPDGTPTWNQGDLARIDEDGAITPLGRGDDAVKIRGYLVEPSEIEAAIRRIDAVAEAIVVAVATEGQPTRLVAYVATKADRRTVSPAAIRRALREELPSYMVPATVVPMVSLPRTERGKVDRAALPKPPAPGGTGDLSELVFDQWELVIAQIWCEVLGLGTLGPDDDFTELGGDSLSAEEMLALVDERLGVDLRSSDLLQNPTVRSFARVVRAGKAAIPTHPDIVCLSKGGAARNLFCIAGGGALALTFLPLSRHLPEYNVFALHQHGLERRDLPDWSIRAVARRNVELIRVVQPTGPYLLAGHSFGGIVALEMASILAEAGEQVEHLVFLDSYLPRTTQEQGALEFGRLPDPEPRRGALPKVGRAIDRQVRRVLPAGFSQLNRIGARLRAYGAGVVRWEGQRHFDAFFDQAVLMSRRYEPPVYAGTATFVMADNNPDGPDGWHGILIGDVRIVSMAGEHSSILREPYVDELADIVATALESGVATSETTVPSGQAAGEYAAAS